MSLIHSDTRLCDVIRQDPSVIPVINRFGVDLGVGDYSVQSVCRSHSIDEEFFLAILNTFINESYFPEKTLKAFNIDELLGYMVKTNAYYAQFQLPNIERHFSLLLRSAHDDNNNLGHIMRFFEGMKQDLVDRIAFDNDILFPYIASRTECLSAHSANGLDAMIEDKLGDLKSMFIKHLSGSYDQNLCYGVVVAIVTLEKDIRQNNRIRRNILLPLAEFKSSYQ
ncbi:MAG: helix-turn-helix transcriptional regulator [Muribaculum sp.]|nr:helix-turn-helix transcriptional regulator [Muribaculum sp.]